MKVILEDREIWIEFAYRIEPALPPALETYSMVSFLHDREVTTCLLRDASARHAEREPPPVLAQGTVTRYYKDPPNRELARKHALAKALQNLDEALPLPRLIVGVRKARRKLFWEAYLNRKRAAAGRAAV